MRDCMTLYASQAAKSVRVVRPPGINEAVLRLCCVHNCYNHDINYGLLTIEDRCNTSFAKSACYVHI